MRRVSLVFFIALATLNYAWSQKVQHPPINNMKGMMLLVKNDNAQERFSIEANLGKIFATFNMPLVLSINMIKQGESLKELASTRVQGELNTKNINSVLVVVIRGFDQRFKPRTKMPATLEEMLEEGNLYPISQEEVTTVTIEFIQFINGKFNGYHMMRVGNASVKSKVYSKIQKKLNRQVPKWRM
jgi:hypothetical protein